MDTLQKKWTHSEFYAYLLFYAAHADIDFNEQEQTFIKEKVTPDVYVETLSEFSKDNDYQRLEKLIAFSKQQTLLSKEEVILEIKNLFLADGQFHKMEKMLLMALRKIL